MNKLPLLAVIFSLILLSCKNSADTSAPALTSEAETIKYEIKIEGMSCTGCEEAIQKCVNEFDGITKVVASHELGNAIIESSVQLSDTIKHGITNKINETGYTVVSLLPVNQNQSLN